MPDQTNITDFDPATGETTTTLVSSHDRGSMDWAVRQEGGKPNKPMTGGDTPTPTLASLNPNTVSAAAGAITVTLTGTNFVNGATARIDGADRSTTFVSATSLTVSYDPTTAGTRQFSVRNPDGETTANVPFIVTA